MRFKEFSGEWKRCKIGKILKIKSGKDQKAVEKPNGKYNIYGTGGIIGKTDAFLYDKESIGIGRKGTIDRPFYFNQPFWTVDTLFYSEIKKDHCVKFIYYIFETINWKMYDESTGVPSLSSSTIESIGVYVSNKKEQQKISDFLTLIDKRIETQMKIIEEIKSLMHNIKNKVIENSIFVKWIKIKDICTITTGKLDANAMKENGKYKFFTCSKDDYYIDEYAFDGEALIISGNGELGLIKYYNGKFNAYQRTYVLQNFKLNPVYIKFMMEYYLPRKIYKEKNIGAMPYIVLSTIAELEIPVVDNRIIEKMERLYLLLNKRQNIDNIQLNNLKKQKQFLLNNMFI